jgi:prophage regulatory protein
MVTPSNQLPQTGFLRGFQVWGCKRRKIPPLIPICRSSFLAGVKSGKFAIKPVKLSERCTAYRVEDIRALIVQLGGAA